MYTSFIAVLVAALSVTVSGQNVTYTQYAQYPKGDCAEQPFYITSSTTGQCQIAGTPASQCTQYSGESAAVYSSQLTTCSKSSLNMDGIVQLFVATYSWTSSGSCQGDVSSVEAVMADAECHPAQSNRGVVTAWLSVNCNGGRPIYKTCKDASCSDCTIVKYDDKCQVMGAASSKVVKCLYPKGWNSGTGGKGLGILGDDYTDGAPRPAQGVGMLVSAVASMLVAMLFSLALA